MKIHLHRLHKESLARLLALALRLGVGRVIARPSLRRAIARQRRSRAPSADQVFALRVDVTLQGRSCRATLRGGAQADAAAAGAAAVLRSLLDDEVAEPGAWMPEQVIDPARFFSRLAARSLHVELAAPLPPCVGGGAFRGAGS